MVPFTGGNLELETSLTDPVNTVGGGIHRWYRSLQQASKLLNKYAGFC